MQQLSSAVSIRNNNRFERARIERILLLLPLLCRPRTTIALAAAVVVIAMHPPCMRRRQVGIACSFAQTASVPKSEHLEYFAPNSNSHTHSSSTARTGIFKRFFLFSILFLSIKNRTSMSQSPLFKKSVSLRCFLPRFSSVLCAVCDLCQHFDTPHSLRTTTDCVSFLREESE